MLEQLFLLNSIFLLSYKIPNLSFSNIMKSYLYMIYIIKKKMWFLLGMSNIVISIKIIKYIV
jgi:hypothetical protein